MSSQGGTMTTHPPFARLGAACGIIFSVALFIASGQNLKAVGLAAIVLFLPFLAYLTTVLSQAEGEHGWLARCAFAAGLAGIILKLSSVIPEVVIHYDHVANGTPLHNTLQGIADATTVVCLYPLGIMLAAVCAVSLTTRALPRWLGYFAGINAAALIVNGSFLNASNVPALLLFVIWTFTAGIVLFLRAHKVAAAITNPQPAAAV